MNQLDCISTFDSERHCEMFATYGTLSFPCAFPPPFRVARDRVEDVPVQFCGFAEAEHTIPTALLTLEIGRRFPQVDKDGNFIDAWIETNSSDHQVIGHWDSVPDGITVFLCLKGSFTSEASSKTKEWESKTITENSCVLVDHRACTGINLMSVNFSPNTRILVFSFADKPRQQKKWTCTII